MVSLPPEELATAFEVYRDAIYLHVPELKQAPEAMRIIEHRLNQDMAWQLMGAMQMVEARNHHLNAFSEQIISYHNQDDLLTFVLDNLRELPGITGASLAAFTRRHHFYCEKTAGITLHGHECIINPDEPFQNTPMQKAWMEERPVWINSVLLEEADTCLQDNAQQLGIRSYAIIPIPGASGAPERLLIVYSNWPGFFLSDDKRFFFEGIGRSLGVQLQQINRSLTHFTSISVSKRQHYRALLEQGQVEMVYQPIINPRTGKVIKLEALARLKEADGSLISPGIFLPALGTAQLLTLFDLGLKQACETVKRLHDKGFKDLGVSLNLPTEAFHSPQVLLQIPAIVRACHLDPGHISLEILESGMLDGKDAIDAIQMLRRHGFRIAMDDMGTGESSMARMKTLPLDEIKIDQSFVRPLLDRLDHLDYVDTLMRLAENMDLYCVVEGVENEAIIDMICTLGEAYLQGYGIAPPMPRSQLTDWLQNWAGQTSEPTQPISETSGYQPQTLYGWYARHLKRARVIMDAIPNNIDLLDFDIAAHWQNCPMDTNLLEMGLKGHPIDQAHRAFHDQIHRLQQQVLRNDKADDILTAKRALSKTMHALREEIAAYKDNS